MVAVIASNSTLLRLGWWKVVSAGRSRKQGIWGFDSELGQAG